MKTVVESIIFGGLAGGLGVALSVLFDRLVTSRGWQGWSLEYSEPQED
jgi:hypothetical protein